MFAGETIDRAKQGAMAGAFMASLFSLYVLVLYLLRGNAPFEKLGVSLVGVVIAYCACGLSAGALAGVLWPLTRTRLGATLVGFLSGFLVYAGVGVTMDGPPTSWEPFHWWGAAILGLIVGGGLANVWYSQAHPRSPKPAPEPSRLRTARPGNGSPEA